jgi:hypothetical protein
MDGEQIRYFVLKWRLDMRKLGYPRYEVRSMRCLETDPDWTVVKQDLSWEEAEELCGRLQSQEENRQCNQ